MRTVLITRSIPQGFFDAGATCEGYYRVAILDQGSFHDYGPVDVTVRLDQDPRGPGSRWGGDPGNFYRTRWWLPDHLTVRNCTISVPVYRHAWKCS